MARTERLTFLRVFIFLHWRCSSSSQFSTNPRSLSSRGSLPCSVLDDSYLIPLDPSEARGRPKVNDRPLSPGFWSTQTLRDRLGEIVSPYDDRSRTREANHRLTMGSEYFVTQSALNKHAARESTKCLKPGESFCIPS